MRISVYRWLALACVAAIACTGPEAPMVPSYLAPSSAATESVPLQLQDLEPARVTRVMDGDTIEVAIGGRLYKVRYIGVDTPETKHPTRGIEPYGLEASERNRQLVEGKTVYLEKDVSETDRYKRLLRYVYVDDVMVNAVLVQEGYAQVATYPPDVKYVDEFLELQREAREEGRGLWAGTAGSEAVVGGGCDPAYPDVCIASPPPDLDCGDIPHRRFAVLPPDPHRFDGDGDGIGCEGERA